MTPSPAPHVTPAADSLDVVLQALAHQADVEPENIDLDQPLSAVPGIESVKALRAVTAIEDACDVIIPDDFIFETATVREFASFLDSLRSDLPAPRTAT